MPTETDRLRKGMRLLSAAIATFAQATGDSRRLLEQVARQMTEVVPDSCIVLLREGDALKSGAVWDPDPVLRKRLESLFASGLSSQQALVSAGVLKTGVAQHAQVFDSEAVRGIIPDDLLALYLQIKLHSTLVVPMRVAGDVTGALAILRHRVPEPLDQFDLDLAQDLANHAGLAMTNAKLVEQLREADELRAAQEEAVRANRFLDAIVEHIPDMVFVKDAGKLAFTRFNRAGEELLGMARADLIGKSDYDFFPAEEAEHFQAKDRATLDQRGVLEIPEEPIHTKHGVRWLHTKKVPILADDGTPLYLLGISRDITEDKRQRAALVEAKEKAEAANKELETFSYSVAHDLRAPLRSIDGFAQALADEYAAAFDDTGKRYLQRVRDSAQRMALLIDDLLALSRVTRAVFAVERVDLGALAQATIARLSRAEPDRKIAITVAPDLVDTGDPRLLGIAFDNLIANAWKFTSKTPDATIEIGRKTEDGRRIYFVRDNGAGFDPQFGHKLFGVFQRLHTEAEFPGTGIGLATVARIMTRHRGRIWAEGTLGAGATFYFTLNESEAV